jgi:hypothetical protein
LGSHKEIFSLRVSSNIMKEGGTSNRTQRDSLFLLD